MTENRSVEQTGYGQHRVSERFRIDSPQTLPPGRTPITLRLASRADEIEVVCELPGEAFGADDDGGAGGPPALRGRDLAVALARVLVADAGGGVDVESGDGRARVRLRLPRG